jgi:hypothetical protein
VFISGQFLSITFNETFRSPICGATKDRPRNTLRHRRIYITHMKKWRAFLIGLQVETGNSASGLIEKSYPQRTQINADQRRSTQIFQSGSVDENPLLSLTVTRDDRFFRDSAAKHGNYVAQYGFCDVSIPMRGGERGEVVRAGWHNPDIDH